MAISNKVENFKMTVNEVFLQKAIALEPELNTEIVHPIKLVHISKAGQDYSVVPCGTIEDLSVLSLKKGDSFCLDFGQHCVGYLSFSLLNVESPADAPAHLQFLFGEHPCEIAEDISQYDGAISGSWIQQETVHIDLIPSRVRLPRRYAFRYLAITVIETSPKYDVRFQDFVCETVTSADESSITSLELENEQLVYMDHVAIKTLKDCMQKIYEDGPKRDRRLWIGDLRLQAMTDYVTFKNYNLVKRCLYLFAALTQNEGRVGACLFVEPQYQVDDTALFDYSLFFISCLFDYFHATGDRNTLLDLWDTAWRQIELAELDLDENGLVIDKSTWWCFIDWHSELNKQASAQAILIYTLKQAHKLALLLQDNTRVISAEKLLGRIIQAARTCLWDQEQGFFLSGQNRQVSWASQVWFVLSGIYPKELNKALLLRLIESNPAVGMVTPYMFHHFVEALLLSDLKDIAQQQMVRYWGGMLDLGADCFWELYNPENIYESPYGSRIINSYCHAWSCTPSYLLRKYFTK